MGKKYATKILVLCATLLCVFIYYKYYSGISQFRVRQLIASSSGCTITSCYIDTKLVKNASTGKMSVFRAKVKNTKEIRDRQILSQIAKLINYQGRAYSKNVRFSAADYIGLDFLTSDGNKLQLTLIKNTRDRCVLVVRHKGNRTTVDCSGKLYDFVLQCMGEQTN